MVRGTIRHLIEEGRLSTWLDEDEHVESFETIRARLSQAGAGGVVPAAGRDKLVGEALAKFLPLVSKAAGSEDVPVPADDFAVILGLLKASLPNQASAVEAAYERALREMEATFRRNKERSRLVGLMREKFRNEIAALAPSPSAGEPVAWQLQFDDGAWSPALYSEPDAKAALAKVNGIVVAIRPLYATPPAPIQTASVEAVRDRMAAAIIGMEPDRFAEWKAEASSYPNCYQDQVDRAYLYADRALASLTPAPTQGDGVPEGCPPVGTVCGISGANSDFNDKRTYTDAKIIAYTPDGLFGWFQKDGCWPWQERLSNCLFRDSGQEEARDA